MVERIGAEAGFAVDTGVILTDAALLRRAMLGLWTKKCATWLRGCRAGAVQTLIAWCRVFFRLIRPGLEECSVEMVSKRRDVHSLAAPADWIVGLVGGCSEELWFDAVVEALLAEKVALDLDRFDFLMVLLAYAAGEGSFGNTWWCHWALAVRLRDGESWFLRHVDCWY